MRRVIVGVVAIAIAIGACSIDESLKPASAGRSGGETQGVIGLALPADLRVQAEEALARDAFRREHRFLDAVKPRHLFDATRVLQADIEAGAWTSDELFQIGGQLFNFAFTPEVGFGARDLPSLSRFQKGRRGGPEASKCASCHWRGGPAGGGDAADAAYLDGDGDSQSSTLARNPIALPGAGLVEILANEMSADLQAVKRDLLATAAKEGAPVKAVLVSKGISFGVLVAKPDGSIDASDVEGVDTDLRIKPFGWKGNVATIRDAVEDALLIHHGMESDHLVANASKDRVGPYGGDDPDGDAVKNEITEGQVSALTLYVAMQETPQIVAPLDSVTTLALADGRARFEAIGCASCHTPKLSLASTTFVLASRSGGVSVSVDLAREAAEPRIAPSAEDGRTRASVFSDFKRHDMGPQLADPRADRGVAGAMFLTRPLWGVARSGPYLHDGRAATLEDAILAHGGEAQKSRDAYAALDDAKRGTVRVFLTSLTRAKRMVAQ